MFPSAVNPPPTDPVPRSTELLHLFASLPGPSAAPAPRQLPTVRLTVAAAALTEALAAAAQATLPHLSSLEVTGITRGRSRVEARGLRALLGVRRPNGMAAIRRLALSGDKLAAPLAEAIKASGGELRQLQSWSTMEGRAAGAALGTLRSLTSLHLSDCSEAVSDRAELPSSCCRPLTYMKPTPTLTLVPVSVFDGGRRRCGPCARGWLKLRR